MKIDMFIRMKAFAETGPYDQFAITVAHEFSHIVLDAINHPLRRDEKAVDLTAMILGFSYLYLQAAHSIRRVNFNQFERRTIGYLSEHELEAACKILVPRKLRAKQSTVRALWHTKQRLIITFVPILVLAGTIVFFGMVADSLDFIQQQWKARPHGDIRVCNQYHDYCLHSVVVFHQVQTSDLNRTARPRHSWLCSTDRVAGKRRSAKVSGPGQTRCDF